MSEAVISGTRLAAAHDGVAELIVILRHVNGATSEVALDHLAANALMSACEADSPQQLPGHSWSKVREALAVSWNRFQTS